MRTSGWHTADQALQKIGTGKVAMAPEFTIEFVRPSSPRSTAASELTAALTPSRSRAACAPMV